ncbi:imidazoleglycerol-phosphate dehydratase [Desulfovibrio sp.]|uniref:imidazoleglycerol-phosphate dehydratase n=1 Tax=Desulfovibrio sp. TaxID=885 RepID=UPI0023CD598C|nr:imidazoleglycerol-phosphate dehydratase [Desulfovibrio sp.]MDE7241793.1 imidazoleglycerol-phosphate dehydratase [Desulfovibrio sp.]
MSEAPLPVRRAEFARRTRETDIRAALCLDGAGVTDVHTGIGLLDHLLTLTMFWAEMDLTLTCKGDLEVDAHHSAEDTGLAVGTALRDALGDRSGIARVGQGRVPMDEALADVVVDLSGRPWLEWRGDELLPPVIAGEEKDLWREFYKALASAARCNLHVSFLYGKNGHHLLESAAKGLGLALGQAARRRGTLIRSTKGGLDA